jgi:predicted RNA methylase
VAERKTESLVRASLKASGFYNESIVIDEQTTSNRIIKSCLAGAGKGGKGGRGFPEFIISSRSYPDFLIVIECKEEARHHISTSCRSLLAGKSVIESDEQRNKRSTAYAVDGAIHYGKFLAKKFNVVTLGVSGVTKKEMKISAHLLPYGANNAVPLLDFSGKPVEAIESLKVMHDYASRDRSVEEKRVKDLMTYARELHNFMRDYAKVSENEKPLLVSGALLALQSETFQISFRKATGDKLPKKLFQAIKEVVEDAEIPQAKKERMLHPYTFIATHPELCRPYKKDVVSTPLQEIIEGIADHVFPFIANVSHDIVGQFYGEFLRYAGGDKKGLGIVLTPKHITEIFCDIAKLSANDVVLDLCCGTGSFLIAAMHAMLNKAGTEDKREHIRKHQLIGVEQQPHMFALAASNMILRGDGKANLYQDSCFEVDVIDAIKNRKKPPTVGFINPPYSQKGEGLHEFNFIDTMLDCLTTGGVGLAIVPLGCAVGDHPMKEVLLKKHSLEAVMSLPEKLFYPVGVIPCIMMFRAHKPHYDEPDSEDRTPNHKTWFGLWKEDGFVQTKLHGRADYYNKWQSIRRSWLDALRDEKEAPGIGIRVAVNGSMEWCAEAYVETDYSRLTLEDFEREFKKYHLFKKRSAGAIISEVDEQILLEGD